MYKNFSLTESEKEQILNQHKEHGYKAPVNEQAGSIGQAVSAIANQKQTPGATPAPASAFRANASGMLEIDCKAKMVRSKLPKLNKEANALLVKLYCEPTYRAQPGSVGSAGPTAAQIKQQQIASVQSKQQQVASAVAKKL